MEPSRHLSPDSLEHFALMPVSERRVLLRHVRECRRCSNEAARVWRLAGSMAARKPATSHVNLDSVLARVAEADAALRWERERAFVLFKEIEQHPQPRRQTIVRNSRRFWLWGFAELLLAKSRNGVFDDPAVALDLAELAVDVTQRVEVSHHGPALLADLRAQAFKALGNARRAVSDLRGAEEALLQAQEILASGSGDPLEFAQLDYCWGALRNLQRRFGEAIAHYDRAFAVYDRLGDTHEAARVLVGKAITVAKTDPHESIRLQRLALPLIDGEREPRLLLAAMHNFAIDLVDTGHPEEALRMLDDLRPTYERMGERIVLMRLRWIEAQAAMAMGNSALAEQAYLEIIGVCEKRELHYDRALASLELATLYAEQGRTAEIKKLALEMIPIFQALEIQRETTAALMLFRQAAETEAATLALIQHVAAFVKRAQHDPAASFSPPS